MARPHGYKRLTRKARHLIRHLRRSKHASVQRVMVAELRHEIDRRWWRKPRQVKMPDLGRQGHWRPLTWRAKRLLTRLRKAKVWQVQRQLVNELAREIECGRRLAERIRRAAERARARAEAIAKRLRAAAVRARRAGGWIRHAVSRGQERLLARAERKLAEREKSGRPGRAWQFRRAVRENAEHARRRFRARRGYRRVRQSLPARASAPRAPRAPRWNRPVRAPRAPRPPRARRTPRAPRPRLRTR